MTEADWNRCTDLAAMLEFLRTSGRASDRKLRLFAVACFARIHPQAGDENRLVIELGERYADGYASDMERQTAWETIDIAKWQAVDSQDFEQAAHLWARQRPVVRAMTEGSGIIGLARSVRDGAAAVLVRCVFGNPFRPVSLDPAWLAWNDGTVQRLTTAIYAERRFGDLPVLADALEEAGCDNREMLRHCREQGQVHVRGCWLVDLLLGKG
jgi:hypothetical protein